MNNIIKFKSISEENYEVLEDLALHLDTEDLDEVLDYLIYHWIETSSVAEEMGYFPMIPTPIDTIPKENDKPKEKYNGKLPF